MKELFVVILAGGKGERFWPLSTPEKPKPFLKFFSDRSLLQQTYDRARKLVPAKNILLVVGRQHEEICREQLPELSVQQILLEPVGRDTSAAIGYAASRLPDDALMLVFPADHLIPDQESFVRTIRRAVDFVREKQYLVTFGIKPDRPETNYGYMEAKKQPLTEGIYPIARFVEKPDAERAKQFLLQGSYYWNSGIFLWRVSHIRQLIALHLPDLGQGLLRLTDQNAEKIYSGLPRISIDFGVLEKSADQVAIVPAAFPWDDIGTWNSLFRVLPVGVEGNLIRGTHYGVATSHCIIYSEDHTIVTAGIEDLIIVQSGKKILVCSRTYADRLKTLLTKLPS